MIMIMIMIMMMMMMMMMMVMVMMMMMMMMKMMIHKYTTYNNYHKITPGIFLRPVFPFSPRVSFPRFA